jgi:hypothetical protein
MWLTLCSGSEAPKSAALHIHAAHAEDANRQLRNEDIVQFCYSTVQEYVNGIAAPHSQNKAPTSGNTLAATRYSRIVIQPSQLLRHNIFNDMLGKLERNDANYIDSSL